ncbi:MAG: T9SS type A sorting domain-containing protein [Saprospiraceae bacterium]
MLRITLLFLLVPTFLLAQTVTTISPNSGVTDDLVFDADGNLLGADYSGSAIYKVTLPDGTPSIFSDGYNTPNGLAFDSNGILYMADNIGNKIYKIFGDGSKEEFVSLVNPSGLIFELDSDTLIATSYMGDRLVKIAPDGTMITWTAGNNLSGGPVGLCYDEDGNLYVGNFDNRKITKILPDGSQQLLVQGPTSGPLGFIAYANGYIYGTLFSTHKIFRTDLEGNAQVILGSTNGTVDGDASMAKFSAPNGILASKTGDTLYVSDFNTSNIRMITNLDDITSSREASFTVLEFTASPNPFMDMVTASFELEMSTNASLELTDATGRLIQKIVDQENMTAGKHQFEIEATDLPDGVYYLTLRLEKGQVLTQKIVRAN